MTQQTIKVQNVKCGGCASAIETGLSSVDGVQQVSVDIAQGIVTVEGNVTTETVAQTLTSLGYPPVA